MRAVEFARLLACEPSRGMRRGELRKSLENPKLSIGRRMARGVAAGGFGRHGRLSADRLSDGLGHGRVPGKVKGEPLARFVFFGKTI